MQVIFKFVTWRFHVLEKTLVSHTADPHCFINSLSMQRICPPLNPPPDPLVLQDNARGTVVAEITAEAQANPTAVFTQPPTYTPYPTYTAVVIPTETPTPGPTATPKPSGNQAKFLYANTFPENRRVFYPNETFNIAFGFENIGEDTWDPSYALVYVGG